MPDQPLGPGQTHVDMQPDGSSYAIVELKAGGAVTATPANSATGTPTNVASSATSVTILAANAARLGGLFYNDSTAVLYLLLAAGPATATRYTTQIPPGGLFELPGPAIYTGIVTGAWATANGNARVTELT